MTVEVEKLRSAVEDLLKANKALTEREVKAAAAKALKTSPEQIGAGIIRAVRRKLRIDRPAALAFARQLIAKDPLVGARTVIEAVGEKFGIRLGPPDVSRLRPQESRRPRRKAGTKPAAGARAAGKGRAAAPAAAAAAPAPPSGPAPAAVAVPLSKGEIAMTFEGRGAPAELARFFLSLAKG